MISAAVLDFYDDSNQAHMAKIAMPAYMRKVGMTILTPEQHGQLSDRDFGLVLLTKRASVLRKYPVNDPGNAWLSAQYFDQSYEKLAFPARFVAAKFIKQACEAYGVPASSRVDAYAARADEEIDSNVFVEGSEKGWMLRKLAQRELMDKTAEARQFSATVNLPDSHYALVVQTGDGEVIRKYAMPDAQHVKMAAAYFDKYAQDFHPDHRRQFAASVVNRADELGVDLDGYRGISKWASNSWNPHVVAHIEQRKSLLPGNVKAASVLNKLAASLAESSPADVAAALETFDNATGLARYYDRGLADPYASTMGKVAEEWSDDSDGQMLTKSDLDKAISSGKLEGYFGEAFVKQLKESPVEIYESLPAPEKLVIKQVALGG